MKKLALVIATFLLIGNGLYAKPVSEKSEIKGKDEIKVVTTSKVVRIKISEDLNDPLGVFLFDKKGNQLDYKYWENTKLRIIEFEVPNEQIPKVLVIEVTENGETIFRKSMKVAEQ